jgi:malonyl-CoA O-methyltransferase
MLELDKRRVRASFDRAASTYDGAAVLQREVADRLLARLDLIKLTPHIVLDVGSGTGYAARHLARRYRTARVIGLDLAPAMARRAHAQRGWFSRSRFLAGDAERLPLASASVDMVFSSLTMQWCDPDSAFREFARVLRPGGLLMFTSFGPDTLRELRAAWQVADPGVHVHDFIDMHDLGDALLRAGFADPVLDVERLTLMYADVRSVMQDLKCVGAHNAATGRAAALTGKHRFKRFVAAYEAMRREGTIPATHEVVYGHAWAPLQPRSSVARSDGSVAVPLASVKRRP